MTWQQFHWLANIPSLLLLNQNRRALSSLLVLNFKKINQEKINLEFDETSAIRFQLAQIVRSEFLFYK